MNTLTEAKRKEWYTWGKEAYKGTSSMMRGNIHHKDYDTLEKREAVHDCYNDSSYLTEAGAERLRTRWQYSEEAIAEARKQFKDGYNASRKWYKKEDAKMQAVIDKYARIFKEAERIAAAVDVSDIRDGFPCGAAHLYLADYPEASELHKALGHFARIESEAYKYQLPIKFPNYGQCIAFDERICSKVNEYLRTKGILAHVHTWID